MCNAHLLPASHEAKVPFDELPDVAPDFVESETEAEDLARVEPGTAPTLRRRRTALGQFGYGVGEVPEEAPGYWVWVRAPDDQYYRYFAEHKGWDPEDDTGSREILDTPGCRRNGQHLRCQSISYSSHEPATHHQPYLSAIQIVGPSGSVSNRRKLIEVTFQECEVGRLFCMVNKAPP